MGAHGPQCLANEQHLVPAVDLSSAWHRAAGDGYAVERRNQLIVLRHALKLVDEIDDQMQHGFLYERSADDAAPPELDQPLDGLGRMHHEARRSSLDLDLVVADQPRTAATCFPLVEQLKRKERLACT